MGAIATALIAGTAACLASWILTSRVVRRRASFVDTSVSAEKAGQLADALHTRDLVLNSMEEGMLLAAADGLVTFANPAIARLLGSSPKEVAYLNPAQLRHALSKAAGGEHATLEVETGDPAKWLRCSAVPVATDGAALLVVRDVTQTRRLDEVRRDLVANASHELKTPAANIQATAESARYAAHDDPESLPRFLERLEDEAVRLSRIVSDLLDLSRLESGGDVPEAVALREVVTEELARAVVEAERSGVEVASALSETTVNGSRRDLALLVRNLLDNAIHYTGSGGHVDVDLAKNADQAVLRVSDTGVGIPAMDLPRVFERFYRVDRARSRETGSTGLGLSIVKHVAENLGGSVTVESELGQGSRFEVRLPAVEG